MTPKPSPYIAWTTDSGTHELPRYRVGIPLSEQPTREITPLYLLPGPAPLPRPGRFRRLLLALGIVGVVVGLLWAITLLNALAPLAGVK